MGPVTPFAATPLVTAGSPFSVVIGDIGVTPELVVTPNGNAPIGSVQWLVMDRTVHTRVIPTWAIVLAVASVVLFVWFFLLGLLGLLFLLAKEDKVVGSVDVTVQGVGLHHVSQIPVASPAGVSYVRQLVAQAQAFTARGR